MFDELPATRRQGRPGHGIAMGVALLVHIVIVILVGAASLLAAEPIEPPALTVVFWTGAQAVVPPPPPPAAAPRRPEPTTAPVPARRAPTRPQQPEVVPERLPASRPLPTPDGGVEHASGQDLEGVGGGVPDGVVGGAKDGITGGIATEGAAVEPEPLPVGGDVTAPVVLVQVQPRYPEAAKHAGAHGLVVLEAVINPAGQVEGVRVLRGHPLLEAAAVEAIQQWRFEPGRLNGKPTRVYFTLTVSFVLR